MSFKYTLRYGGKNPVFTEILHIWFDYLNFSAPKGKSNWHSLGGTFTLETKEMVTQFQQKWGIKPPKGKPYGEVTAVEWQKLGLLVGFKAWDNSMYQCITDGNKCPQPLEVINFFKSIGGYSGNSLSGGINVYGPRFLSMYAEEFGGIDGGTMTGLGQFLNFMRADRNLTDVRHVAYMMATVYKETFYTWQPIEEKNGASMWYGKLVTVECGGKKYTNRYYGRGYVQLTRTSNDNTAGLYQFVSEKMNMGCDLVAHPEKASVPEIAYKILSNGMKEGWYRTNEKLSKYISGNVCNYYDARNIVNSAHDRASEIEGYARVFEALLRATMFR